MNFTREKGLQNSTGENNCFLNVVIQGLWHFSEFRNKFLELPEHKHVGSDENTCIVCALAMIFAQFQFGDTETLTPVALRIAMSQLFEDENKFQLGKLADASEALVELLTLLHHSLSNVNESSTPMEISDKTKVETIEQCEPPCFIHQLFSINILEQRICTQINCKASSEPFTHSTFVYYTYVAQWQHALRLYSRSISFGTLLKKTIEADTRPCTNQKCGKECKLQQYLFNSPKYFVVGLVWPTDVPSQSDIKTVFEQIDEKLLLNQIFEKYQGTSSYRLKGMICYYGKHYDAYFVNHENKWWVFDDAMVKEISRDWNDVPPRCTIGKFQPSLLFYEREDEVSPVILTSPKLFNPSISSSIDALSNQAISNYSASYSKPITTNNNKPLTSSSNSIYNTSTNKSLTSNSNSIYNTDKSNGNTSLSNSKTSDTSSSHSSINSTSSPSKNTTPDREYTLYSSPSISESASNYVTSNSIASNPIETHNNYGYYSLHSKSYTNTSEASNTKSLSSSSKTSQDSDSIKNLKRSNSLLDSTNEDIKKSQQSSSQVLDPFMTWAHGNPPVSERIKQIEESNKLTNPPHMRNKKSTQQTNSFLNPDAYSRINNSRPPWK